MATITVHADTSSAYRYAYISSSPPPMLYMISGRLPGGRRLTRPIIVVIEYDDEEVIVTEPRFHMHASGPTKAEAMAAFRRILSGYLDVLTRREKTLGPPLRDQLNHLRSLIASE